MEDYQMYLDPVTLSKIGRLDLKAKLIVEGFIAGQHKSPFHGFSIEFAEHREYSPGDDLKHLDWKVFGKTDRYYIKQYEEETNLRCHILVDTSESMAYGSGQVSKMQYACYVAASMGYMICNQQDAAGLTLFDREIRMHLPAKSSQGHLRLFLHELSKIVPERKSDMSGLLHEAAEMIERRGMVIVISDFFDDVDRVVSALQHFRHKRHEVIVFHVLDASEMTFPFQELTLFDGLEEYPKLRVDPKPLRKEYLNIFNEWLGRFRRGCSRNQIDYVLMNTDQRLDVALTAYLATRAATSRRDTRKA